MGGCAEKCRGERVRAAFACLHDAEIFLRQLGQVGQRGFRGGRQTQMYPDHRHQLTHCGGGLGQLSKHLPRALGQQCAALVGLGVEMFVAP